MYDILIIEDDQLLLQTMIRSLRARGYTVAGSRGPDEAMALVRDHQFHVLAADYVMPGVDGVQILDHLREIQPEATRVLLSGLMVPDDVSDGVDVFLQKPFSISRIADLIDEHRSALGSEAEGRAGAPLGDPLHLGGAALAKSGAR